MGSKKLTPDMFNDDAIRDLAFAICIQAAMDYKQSLNDTVRHKKHQPEIKDPIVYERFFYSDWFKNLSGFEDSENIIRNIRKNKDKKINVFDVL